MSVWLGVLIVAAFLILSSVSLLLRPTERKHCSTNTSFRASLYRSKVCDNGFFPLEVEEYDVALSGSALRGK
ncbi:MAG: hypothetical protein ACFFF4_15145 [Candidatus Thorarchaeota archaeon]